MCFFNQKKLRLVTKSGTSLVQETASTQMVPGQTGQPLLGIGKQLVQIKPY